MNDLQLNNYATELFQQSLISKTELAKYKAQEKALYELYEYTQNSNYKNSKISGKKLELLSRKVEICESLIDDISVHPHSSQREMKLSILEQMQVDALGEMLSNYSHLIPMELKEQLTLELEYKKS